MSHLPEDVSIDSPREPPIAKYLYRFVNPIISAILQSPLHWTISNQLMLIMFLGRVSGRRIMTPVAYRREGDTLKVLVHRPWWKNLRDGATVTVWLQGRGLVGRSNATQDPELMLPWLRQMIEEKRRIKKVRRLGMTRLDPNRSPTDAELLHAMRGVALVSIRLDPE